MPATKANVPMPGTKEYTEWKAQSQEQADTFNGKEVAKEKTPTILDKIIDFLKGLKYSSELPPTKANVPMP